jgi:Putative transposase
MSPPASTVSLLLYTDSNRLFKAKPTIRFSLAHIPAIANERLKRNRAVDVVLQLKSAFKDSTTHIVMAPLEFIQRLAALVPRPRLHLIRFHGVLAPNAKLRSEIIPSLPVEHTTAPACDHAQAQGRAGAHELGQAAQTGLRHRHRTLPELRRQLEDHRLS